MTRVYNALMCWHSQQDGQRIDKKYEAFLHCKLQGYEKWYLKMEYGKPLPLSSAYSSFFPEF